jgi:hypothetical protein
MILICVFTLAGGEEAVKRFVLLPLRAFL